jgi:hypothetical protein
MKIGDYYISRLKSRSTQSDSVRSNFFPNSGFKNHHWVIDRSLSMGSEISQLLDDIVENSTKLNQGDHLSVYWFSGNHENGAIFRDYQVVDSPHAKKFVEEKMKHFRHSVGLTCFSEILNSVSECRSSEITNANSVLCFFTDGYPVVSNYNEEIQKMSTFCDKLSTQFHKKVIIGYGEYYNLVLLNEMASSLDGTFVHNSNLKETRKTFMDVVIKGEVPSKNYISLSKETCMDDYYLVCSECDGQLYIHNVLSVWNVVDGSGSVTVTGKEAYLLTKKEIKSDTITEKTFYVIAAALVQNVKTDTALDVLNLIGDKYLIDQITNSFTIGEYGETSKKIMEASSDHFMARFKEGRVLNYLPPADAFCIFDLFDVLMGDKDAFLLPFHDSFQYKRIGKIASLVDEDNAVKFVPNLNQRVPFSEIVWNKEKMNLSILTKIEGCVDLTKLKLTFEEINSNVFEFMKNLENPKEYPTFQYRNYTFIKSCILNLEKLPITCSDQTKLVLTERGIVESSEKGQSGADILVLRLKTLPLVNRNMATNRMSASKMAEISVESIRLESKIKVYKEKQREKLVEDALMESANEDQVSNFLTSKGFRKDGLYAPKTTVKKNSELIDFYMAKVFKIKIRSASSIPKVSAVETKVRGKKKMNWVEKEMADALSESKNVKNFEEIIGENKEKLKILRKKIQREKFGMIVGKTWFKEFDSYNGCKVKTIDNIDVTFELKEEKVFFE